MNLLDVRPRPSIAALPMTDAGAGERRLEGRTALVTGAAGGLGRSFIALVQWLGARVVGWVREPGAGLGDDVLEIAADLRDPHAIERAVTASGPIDVLVCNAAAIDPADIATVFAVNVFAVHSLIERLSPLMVERGHGRIVVVTSDLSITPAPAHLAYAASKAALNSLAASWAARLAGTGVLVNALHPGHVRTRMNPEGTDAPDAMWAMASTLMACDADGPTGRCFGPAGELDWLSVGR